MSLFLRMKQLEVSALDDLRCAGDSEAVLEKEGY